MNEKELVHELEPMGAENKTKLNWSEREMLNDKAKNLFPNNRLEKMGGKATTRNS